ncbi:MAG: hypothetical protein HZA48_10455 [Planctomycetes bacterium]|nr:hypothetical protein [Planctomycetota bacterium]
MAKKKAKVNIYKHSVDLASLKIKNQPNIEFCKALEAIKYKGYKVEDISDGRNIVITKPGGKYSYGTIKREDFMVWIYNEKDESLWLISHQNILDDLKEKANSDPRGTLKIIDGLMRVYNGEEPDDILKKGDFKNPIGEIPEAIFKAYKWIWGQEDCNYLQPKYKGRAMSWEGWEKVDSKLEKSGDGIADLREKLKEQTF